jgi:hypothetical protein
MCPAERLRRLARQEPREHQFVPDALVSGVQENLLNPLHIGSASCTVRKHEPVLLVVINNLALFRPRWVSLPAKPPDVSGEKKGSSPFTQLQSLTSPDSASKRSV